jgi:hypothetical protein
MTTFKIGDCVRRETDKPDKETLIIRHYAKDQVLAISESGKRVVWASQDELELVESNHDIKQAIREVLLSDEFLAAFARAWTKTPILHNSEINLTPIDPTAEGFVSFYPTEASESLKSKIF